MQTQMRSYTSNVEKGHLKQNLEGLFKQYLDCGERFYERQKLLPDQILENAKQNIGTRKMLPFT
jgi:hypothetical protein